MPDSQLISNRQIKKNEKTESLLCNLLNTCEKILSLPISKLDWYWFHEYILNSPVCTFIRYLDVNMYAI